MWQPIFLSSSSNLDDSRKTPGGDLETGEVCIPNISMRERRKRLAAGVIQFVISIAVLAILIATGAERGWRLILFLFFAGAASGFFQWRDKT